MARVDGTDAKTKEFVSYKKTLIPALLNYPGQEHSVKRNFVSVFSVKFTLKNML